METRTLRPAETDAGKRVDAWLAGQLEELTRSAAQRLLEEGRVTLDGKPLAKNRNPSTPGLSASPWTWSMRTAT